MEELTGIKNCFKTSGKVIENASLDDLDQGYCRLGNGCTPLPEGESNSTGQIVTFQMSGAKVRIQILAMDDNHLYFRTQWYGNWFPFVKIL